MDISKTSLSMLATHVNDLRRMWFVEHDKNQKLKLKLSQCKKFITKIQNKSLSNDGTNLDLNISSSSHLDNSCSSITENIANISFSKKKLMVSLIKIFLNNIRNVFEIMKQKKYSSKDIKNIKENNQNKDFKENIPILFENVNFKKIMSLVRIEKIFFFKIFFSKNFAFRKAKKFNNSKKSDG